MNVTVETLEKVKADFVDCLNHWEIPNHAKGVDRIIEEWDKSKAALRNTFRKSKYWDEEAQAVVYKIEEQRIVDVKAAEDFIVELFTYVYQRVDDDIATLMEERKVGDTYFTLSTNVETFITAEVAREINNSGFITVAEGEKQSRVWGKFYKALGATSLTDKDPEHPEFKDFKSYDKIYAKLADSLNPMKIERISLLSLHPNDYINMSHGTGWHSCHRAGTSNNPKDRGQYFGGAMSYLLDDVSAIMYTIDKKFSGTKYSMEPKIKRQVICFGENWFLTSRLYPSSFDGQDKEYEPYRNFIQSVYAECLGIPNLWVVRKSAHESKGTLFTTTKDSPHYKDYEYSGNNPTVSYPKGVDSNNLKPIQIGSLIICPWCGKTHARKNNIYCDYCAENIHECTECGCRISKSDIINATYSKKTNSFVCHSCSIVCPDCGKMISASDNVIWVEGKGIVCEHCSKKYKWDSVAEVYYEGDSFFLEDIGILVSQISLDMGLVAKCEDCGMYYLVKNMENGKCSVCNTENKAQSA